MISRVMKAAAVAVALVLSVVAACSSGSTSDRCSAGECVRAVTCRKGDCNGPVVVSGCCSCIAGEVDEDTCTRTPTPSPTSTNPKDCGQCIRAVTCRRGGCGGPVTQVGCCLCPSGDIDDDNCPPDAGPDASDASSD